MVSSPDTPGLPEPDESRFLKSVNDYKEHNWSNTVSFPILALKKKKMQSHNLFTLCCIGEAAQLHHTHSKLKTDAVSSSTAVR